MPSAETGLTPEQRPLAGGVMSRFIDCAATVYTHTHTHSLLIADDLICWNTEWQCSSNRTKHRGQCSQNLICDAVDYINCRVTCRHWDADRAIDRKTHEASRRLQVVSDAHDERLTICWYNAAATPQNERQIPFIDNGVNDPPSLHPALHSGPCSHLGSTQLD